MGLEKLPKRGFSDPSFFGEGPRLPFEHATLSASTWAMSKPNASAAAQETAKLWENTHGGVSPSSRAVGSAFQDLSTTKSLPSPPKIHEMSASFELPTVQKSWTHAHVRSAAPFHSAQARALAHNSRNAT